MYELITSAEFSDKLGRVVRCSLHGHYYKLRNNAWSTGLSWRFILFCLFGEVFVFIVTNQSAKHSIPN